MPNQIPVIFDGQNMRRAVEGTDTLSSDFISGPAVHRLVFDGKDAVVHQTAGVPGSVGEWTHPSTNIVRPVFNFSLADETVNFLAVAPHNLPSAPSGREARFRAVYATYDSTGSGFCRVSLSVSASGGSVDNSLTHVVTSPNNSSGGSFFGNLDDNIKFTGWSAWGDLPSMSSSAAMVVSIRKIIYSLQAFKVRLLHVILEIRSKSS